MDNLWITIYMENNQEIGRKIRDINSLVDLFQVQEGVTEHIIGRTGGGKNLRGGPTCFGIFGVGVPSLYQLSNDSARIL